jgi:sulfate adenylyltransferase subunit 1
MIVGAGDLPSVQSELDVILCWMNPRPLQLMGKYALKHTTRDVRCLISEVQYILNINTLEKTETSREVKMNEIARVRIKTTKPLFFDPYNINRITGSLILIDEGTNETVAAGMIVAEP